MKDYFGGGTIGVYCPLLYYFGKNDAKGNDPLCVNPNGIILGL